MPYTNIVFVKFRTKLLSDTRFLDRLDDDGKLVFLGLLLLAGTTHNRIPNNSTYIKRHLNLALSNAKIDEKVAQICSTFHNVKRNSEFIKFSKFNKLHNWLGSKIGEKKESPEKNRIDKEKNKNICMYFSEVYKTEAGVAYPMSYAKDKTIIYDLMSIYDEPTLKTLIKEFFESARDPKEWWADKLSIGVFKSVIPQLIGKLRKK